MAIGRTNAIGKSKLQEKDVTITQNGTYQVAPDTGYDGMSKATIITNVPSTPTEEKTVDLSMASGNQVITPTSGKVLSKVTITKPSTLIASNIKKNVVIAGITGSYEFKTQNKTFTPTQTGGSVSADSGYDGLGVVTVNPVPLGNKTDVPLNFYNQNTGTIADSQNIYSDENKFMTRASVARPATLVAANIKKDVNIAGIVGTLEEGETLPAYTGLLRFSSTPTISLSNSTLTITAVANATSYAIYSDNTLLTTITTTSVDLSTYFTEGIHTIYAIAKATGYADSEKSNEVSYEVAKTYNLLVRYSGQFNPQFGSGGGGILVGLNSSNPDIALEVQGNIVEYRSPNKVDHLQLTTGTGPVGQDNFANVGYVTIMATGANAAYAFNGGNLTPVPPEPTSILLPGDSQLEIFVYYVF